MLASASDAEDVLQEAYLRWHRAANDGVEIESSSAYLSTVVTRLAMDHLRSAHARREEYVGLWLPEPLPTDAPDVAPAVRSATIRSPAPSSRTRCRWRSCSCSSD